MFGSELNDLSVGDWIFKPDGTFARVIRTDKDSYQIKVQYTNEEIDWIYPHNYRRFTPEAYQELKAELENKIKFLDQICSK